MDSLLSYYYITGTSCGLGKALAERLLENENSRVVGISRSCTIEHKHYAHQQLDLSNAQQMLSFNFPQEKEARRIVLVNNASSLGMIAHLGNLPDEEIVNSYQLNVVSPVVLINKFIRNYRNSEAEKIIINISSGAAVTPYDGWSVYCSSKAALDMTTKVVEQEQGLSKGSIQIFSIAPGVVDTQMQSQIRATSAKDFSRKEKFIELHNQKELYAPKDVAVALAEMINHPENIPDTIHRIKL